MAELKSILSQVDSLMNDGKNSPETVAKCQTLMGYAAAINLPQSRKNQLIGQFPPRVQQMYKQVAKSSEAKTAQRGAMQQAMEVAMAQKHSDIFVQNFNQQFMAGNFSTLQGQPPEVWNSCLLNSSINDANSLNVALQNGWDINAKHKNPDGTESTYVEYQGAQIDKGIEGANRANTTIKDLIGKSPRTKEEEEEYRKAQQAAENNHRNLMGNAQNVVNAIKSGKLNPEEMAKAQAELREIEEYEKEQRRLAQYYRDLAAKETDPTKRAELLAQADVHESKANETQQISSGKSTRTQRDITEKDLTSLNDQHTAYSNIARENPSNTLKNKNPKPKQVKLQDLANSNKPISDMNNLNPETRQGAQNVISAMSSGTLSREDVAKAQAEMRQIEAYEKEQLQLAQKYRDEATKETNPAKRAELLAQAESYSAQADQISEIINPKMPTVEQTIGNDAHTLASGRQPNYSDTSANNTALACMYSHQEDTILSNNQHIAYSNIASENRSNTLKNKNPKPKQVKLQDLANFNDLVSDMNNLNSETRQETQNVISAMALGKLSAEDTAKAQEQLRQIEAYEKEQLQLAQKYRDETAKETDPLKRAELLEQVAIHTNNATQTQQLANKDTTMPTTELSIGKDVHTIDSKIASSNHNINTLSRSALADFNEISTNDNFMQHITQPVVSIATQKQSSIDLNLQQTTNNNAPISNDFMALLDTPVNANKTQTNQESLSIKEPITSNHTKKPSAPKLPSLANSTTKSNSEQTTHENNLDLDATITPNMPTQKPSSGLSNAIRLASISIDNVETNQENNMKTLDTSRNA